MLPLVESLHTSVLPYILCIVVLFQPVIKLLQKSVRVHHRRVILMQKNAKIFWEGAFPEPSPSGEGDTPSPNPIPSAPRSTPRAFGVDLGAFGASILTLSILKFCLSHWQFHQTRHLHILPSCFPRSPLQSPILDLLFLLFLE